jgi:hypothetical protein
MQHDWNIQARSNSCQITGEPFQEGEYFYTLLLHDLERHFVRQDLSERAWQTRQQELQTTVEGETSPVFSFWRSLYELPRVEEEPLPSSDAEGMLRYLLQKKGGNNQLGLIGEASLEGSVALEVAPTKEVKSEEVELKQQQQQKTAYILALLLERKKLLKPLPSEKKGLLLYEHPKTGELFMVEDPGLNLTDLEATQRGVMEILKKLSFAKSPS